MIQLKRYIKFVLLFSSFIILNSQITLCRKPILQGVIRRGINEVDSSLKNSHASGGHRPRISGYYPAYNHRIQSPSQINYGLYTDLIFFVATTQAGFKLGYGDISEKDWEALAHEFVKNCKAAKVKPRLAIGGWTGSVYFSDLLETDKKRHDYAVFLKSFADKLGFEGIDIDWEYPHQTAIGCNKNRPDDLLHLGEFLSTLRKIWPDGEFTAAVSVGGFKSSDGELETKGVDKIAKSLNYINIMAYDIFGGWIEKTGPNAPLSGKCTSELGVKDSVIDSIKIYKDHGFKSSQIVMGIPGYGRSYTLNNPTLAKTNYGGVPSKLYQGKSTSIPPGGNTDDKPGTDVCGAKTHWSGLWRYRELIERGYLTKDGKKGLNGKVRHFDKCTGTPYLTNSTWLLSYDDEESGNLKAQVVKSNSLAGIFYFDTQGPTDSIIKSATSVLKN